MNEIKEWLEECKEKYGNLSGEQLKLIALFFMLLDHVGYRMTLWNLVDNTKLWIHIGDIFRVFGRIAFPIFAFLVAEGFRYTSDRKMYALRMFVFAVISEIPFDMLKNYSMHKNNDYSRFFDISSQNVMLTFFLAIVMLVLIEEYKLRKTTYYAYYEYVYVIGFCIFAYIVRCDYHYFGILLVWFFYKYVDEFYICVLFVALMYFIQGEYMGVVSLIPIFLYNGKRTNKLMSSRESKMHKYFFYVFYPLHMLILSFLFNSTII
ncbi:MAG TPA: hypothetical protein DCL29_02605 [Eubacterium sp.]|nr:hypothetical protein [Eubacterium sp.]HAV90511.1 hypothetical protein [Eubacterium sp.]